MLTNIDNPGAVIGVTDDEATDVLVIRSGELRPGITQPTIIGAVVRIPAGIKLADAIDLASSVIPRADRTETLRVVVADADGIENDDE